MSTGAQRIAFRWLPQRLSEGARKKELLLPAACLVCCACLLVVLHSAYFTWKYFSTTPYWDFWAWISDYQAYVGGHYTLHDLSKPHNEHRIVTTRLVLFADAIFYHMTGRFVVVLNFALNVALGVMLSMLSRTPRASAAGAAVPVAIMVAWMASTSQWFNLVFPFQIQFVLLGLSMVAAAAMVAKSTALAQSHRSAAIWAVLGGLGYCSAAFSVAGGLLELPWLILLLWLRGARRLPAALFVVTACVVVFLFLHDYHPVRGFPLTFSTQPDVLGALLRFTAGVLGSAFYAFDWIAFAAGYVGLALFTLVGAGLMHAVLVRRVIVPGRMLVLFTIAGTLTLMGCAAAVSRLSLGMAGALAPRYATLSLMFWASLLPLTMQYFAYVGRGWLGRRMAGWPLPLALSAAAIAACSLSPRYSNDARSMNGALASQAVAMRQNVYVPDLFSFMLFGGVAEVSDRLAFLHTHQLGVFAPGAGRLPDSMLLPATAADTKSLPSCKGHVDGAYRLDATRFALRGWFAASDSNRAADWVVFLTPDNQLTAAVPATDYRTDLRHALHTHTPPRGIRAGISDVLHNPDGEVTLRAVGLFANDPARTCLLPAPVVFGPLRVQTLPDASTVRPPASAEAPVLQGSFRRNGVPAALQLAAAWPQNAMFSTSGAGDAATGDARFSLTPGATDDIVIPYATGPDTFGQQLSILFADGTRYDQALPADWGEAKWRAIGVPHGVVARHGGGKIVVIAQDTGTRWGQWIAVGTPMLTTLDSSWARLY